MKSTSLLALFLLFFLTSFPAVSQDKTPEQIKKDMIRDHMLFNSAQGREFWIAIPGNENPGFQTDVLDIYVTCGKKTIATIESPPMGVYLSKAVEPLQITTFSSSTGETSWQWEIWESERVLDKGLRITASQPISVYVLNAKPTSSEGYLAIPLSAWGTEYIHCSYYDHNEVRNWATGFCVIASEDRTRIRIELKGVGYAKTNGGRSIGDVLNENMDAGQVFVVKGDATTRGEFDLTGSKIVGNKLIGLLSYHERTHIPSYDVWNGRDHLIEMMPPVHAWGKQYTTVEYKRDSYQGDLFRVVAAEDNTHFLCKYYDIATDQILGNWEGTLKKSGDFQEWLQAFVQVPNDLQSIRGTSVFTADKPILVMQYSYSAEWDGNTIFDPFMIIVVPVEQYIPATVFQTPASKAFTDNWFNIIAVHDPEDIEKNDLKSIEIDGDPIWIKDGSFLLNKIPTTNLYWAKLRTNPGAHDIRGDTKFGGYIYGFSRFDSYGWPAAMAINKLDETDTLEPELYISGVCGDYEVLATELRNGGPDDDPRQVDQGVADVQLLDGSFNYELDLPELIPYPPLYEYTFYINLIDPFRSALGIFAVTDRAGNTAIDTVSYAPDSLQLDPEEFAFGNVRVNTTKFMDGIITNVSDSVFDVISISLKEGDVFQLVEGEVPPVITLMTEEPGQTHNVRVSYTPKDESLSEEDIDVDSLLVETECLTYSFPLTGRGVLPHILVDDFNAGAIPVNETKCKSDLNGQGLEILNTGTDTLVVYGFENVAPPFSVSDPTDPAFPFKIPPGESVYFKDVCFTAPDTLAHELDVVVQSNAVGVDSISNWKGRGIMPGPYITSWDFGRNRRLTENEHFLEMGNKGNTKVYVTDVNLDAPSQHFRIIKNRIQPQLPVELFPENATGNVTKKITIPVEYIPQTEGPHHAEAVPVFQDESIVIPNGMLDGEGFEPKINPSGYTFQPEIIVYTTHQDEGTVVIRSVSQSAPLFIESIDWDDQNQQDFTFLDPLPQNVSIPRGDSITLRVEFTPQAVGERRQVVNILSDRGPGPETDPRREDTVHVVGYAFDTGIEVTPLDFGTVLLCDNPDGTFEIRNNSSTTDLIIDDVRLTSGAIEVFDIENSPTLIQPGNSGNVQVRFYPNNIASVTSIATVYYHFEGLADDSISTTITGEGYTVPVHLTLTDLEGMVPGQTTIDKFPVRMEAETSEWLDAEITYFQIEMVYKKHWMTWDPPDPNIERGPILDNSWTVTGEQTIDPLDPSNFVLTITGQTNDPARFIKKSGILCYPNFLLLLADTSVYHPDFGSKISFGVRDSCVIPTSEPGSIDVKTCVIDLRDVVVTSENYFLQEVMPNPVDGDGFNLNFGVGLKGRTVIDLFNSKSELIETIYSRETKPGKYEEFISAKKLPSGVYFIRMTSGPYTEIKRLVISR